MSTLVELVLMGLPGAPLIRFMMTNPQVGFPMIMSVLMLAALLDITDGRLP